VWANVAATEVPLRHHSGGPSTHKGTLSMVQCHTLRVLKWFSRGAQVVYNQTHLGGPWWPKGDDTCATL